MSAGRTAGHADPLRVDLVLCRIGPQPADGRLGVVDGGRELVLRREAIGDRRRDVAALGELLAERVVRLPLAGAKAAAVNAEDGGQRPVARLRPGQVELQMLVVGIAVLDSRFPNDSIWCRCLCGSRGLPLRFNLTQENIPPTNFAAVRLQLNRAGLRQRLVFLEVVD